MLVQQFGADAVEPLTGYIRTEMTISAAILALAKLISAEALVGLLVDTLSGYAPDDHRSIDAKLQLIDALADLEDERVVPAVTPHAMDHDDDVRIKVMGLIDTRVTPGHERYDTVVAALIEVLKDPHASGRITRRAAESLQVLDANLADQAEALADLVPDGYTFDGAKIKRS